MADDYKQFLKLCELKDRNRCIRCRGRADDNVICERCMEFRYCSIQCLLDDRDDHANYCKLIGIQKGLLVPTSDDETERFKKLKEKARYLNDDGSIRQKEKPLNDPREDCGSSNSVLDRDQSQPGARKPKPRKNKKNKSRRNHGNNNGSNSKKKEDNKGQVNEDKTVESLLKGGRFGGAVRVDLKVQSGKSFGEGWWKPKKESKYVMTGGSSKNGSSRAASERDNQRFTDLYSDSEDEADHKKDKLKEPTERDNNKEKLKKQAESSESIPASTLEPTLEGATSGLELVKYDPKKAEEELNSKKGGSTKGKCSYCKKEGFVLQCSRCKLASYCGKKCQTSHYKEHKDICRRKERFDTALSKVPIFLKMAMNWTTGFAASPFLSDLPDALTYLVFGASFQIMVEIVDQLPLLFTYGALVRDLTGQAIQVVFHDVRYMHTPSNPWAPRFPIPLALCLLPGNFMLLLDAHWEIVLGGARVIRVEDMDKGVQVYEGINELIGVPLWILWENDEQ